MKKIKVELKDLSGENILSPETSLELIDNCPFSISDGILQMGDKNKNLSINASTVKFNDSFGSLTINGIQSFTSNQVISLDSSGNDSFYNHIDPSSLKNFPTMMVFGIIHPKSTTGQKKERWIFGMRIKEKSAEGEEIYRTYGYCSKNGLLLVPGLTLMEITDFDFYVFDPLCLRDFSVLAPRG